MKTLKYILLIILCSEVLPLFGQICPGTPGQIEWTCWRQLFDDEFSELYADVDYPNHPDVTQVRYKIEAPINYDNLMGARMRGFIYVPSTDTVTFNLTANQRGKFWLSTDSDPANKTLLAFVDNYTNEEEHDKYTTQTSVPVVLQAGVDYYFEVVYVENFSADHCSVWWKTDHVNINEWTRVSGSFIKGIDCETACPVAGTSCDDGNAGTTDDIEDGNCNCIGTPTTSNACIGARGVLENFRYFGINGSSLSSLYFDPNFPAAPQSSRDLNIMSVLSSNTTNNSGDLLQTYFTVPVTGPYMFNLTGDDQTILYLSSDDDPANMMAYSAEVTGWTNMTQHDKYPEQTVGPITLTAGQYYYLEVNHKQGGGSEHFSMFWQAPFTPANTWKRIPDLYFYDYTCDIACVREGSVCDDGDPFTNNDVYDNNCECAGTPCSGPDCNSPLASYVPYDKCSVTDQIDNNEDNNWLSCSISQNPNATRGNGHWIMYDLEVKHELYEMQVWNYNVSGSTNLGFENVAVDYSLDGSTWTELGTYTWLTATGDSNYSGFEGPNFNGIEARYIIITSLDMPNTGCRGIGKVAFTAVRCPGEGTLCDDGDPNTANDAYDANCICTGVSFYDNQCLDQIVILGDSILPSANYSAIEMVQSISDVDDNGLVTMIGGNSITLNPGFETLNEAVYVAFIDTCEVSNGQGGQNSRKRAIEDRLDQLKADRLAGLQVMGSEDSDDWTIKFYVEKPGHVLIKIQDPVRNYSYTLVNHNFINKGVYSKRLRSKKLDSGIYTVSLQTVSGAMKEKMVVE